MDYMMLKPSTNQCLGFVSDKQVRKELGLSRARFNNFVMYQKLYKGCILIEDESEEVRDGTTETFELIDTSKTGRRWYISNYLNVVSIGEDGKQREIKPVFDKGSYRVSVNGKSYTVYRLAYEKFIGEIKYGCKVRLKGERNVKNLYLVNNGMDGGKATSKKVVMDGKVYKSITDCARATSYTRVAVSMMLRGVVKNSLGVRYVET